MPTQDVRAPDNRTRRIVQAMLLTGIIVCAAIALALIERHFTLQDDFEAAALHSAQTATRNAAANLDEHLSSAQPVVESLAQTFAADVPSAAEFPQVLTESLANAPALYMVGVALEPLQNSEEPPLFAPHVRRVETKFETFDLARHLDYTAFREAWYVEPLLEGPMWNEPHSRKTDGVVLAEYAVPFTTGATCDSTAENCNPARRPTGAAYGGFSLQSIEAHLDSLDLGLGGYSFILSKQGRYLVHPSEDRVRARQMIFEVAWDSGDTDLYSMSVRTIKGERGHLEHHDNITGQSSWIVYEPIPSVGWALVTVSAKESIYAAKERRQAYLQFVVLAAIVLTLSLMFAVSFFRITESLLWLAVGLGSALLTAATGHIWYLASQHVDSNEEVGTLVVDQASLQRFLDSYDRASDEANAQPPVYVPTGLFVQSIEFVTSTNVKVTGYIWQKYKAGIHDGISRGFVLPEAAEPVVKKVYHHIETGSHDGCTEELDENSAAHRACSELIGWNFSAVLRQRFAYAKYPFDQQDVWLRLWHRDFDRNIVLTPDLQAYSVTDPAALPGVEEDFVLPGWRVESSGFDYRYRGYNADFGIPNFSGRDKVPELYFNVNIARNFLGPFLLHFVPQAVVAVLLFIVLLMHSKDSSHSKWLGFQAKDVIRACAVLIIVLIFDHNSLRRDLAATNLVFLEYFYLVLYVAALAVSFNSIVFASWQIQAIQYRDNLIVKLSYWPIVTLTVFITSLVIFR